MDHPILDALLNFCENGIEAFEACREKCPLTPEQQAAINDIVLLSRLGGMIKTNPKSKQNPIDSLLCTIHDLFEESFYKNNVKRPHPIGLLTVKKTYQAGFPPERQAAAIRRVQKSLEPFSMKEGKK